MMGSRKTVPPRILRIYKSLLSTIHFDLGRGETDRAVWTPPHLLEFEFLDTRLIGGDGRTLDADLVLLDRLCSVDSHGIIGLTFWSICCSEFRPPARPPGHGTPNQGQST